MVRQFSRNLIAPMRPRVGGPAPPRHFFRVPAVSLCDAGPRAPMENLWNVVAMPRLVWTASDATRGVAERLIGARMLWESFREPGSCHGSGRRHGSICRTFPAASTASCR